MASIIPYTSDVFAKLKQNSSPRPQSQMYGQNVQFNQNEFYESLSMEIDLMLNETLGKFGNMILEDDHSSVKNDVNAKIGSTINRYSGFVNSDFADYYAAHHSIGFYEQLLGRGYILECISNALV